MLIENYKGIEIMHNANSDEFYTKIIIRKSSNRKADEFIKAPRLQRVRDEIDKFLNTASKKPILKKAWLRHNEYYQPVTVLIYNAISYSVMVQKKDGRIEHLLLNGGYYDREKLYISCKENDAIIANLNKKQQEIEKIKKETSCSGGKLIPLQLEHFK